jgi:nitroreductase
MHEDVLKILARRSVRSFKTDRVSDEMVRDLLKAAMSAPSARAKDPWHFIVVSNLPILARVSEQLPNGALLAKAPLGIVVCGDLEKAHRKQLSYLLQDCSAAIENLLLAASMLKLGACWLGIHPTPARVEGVRRVFNLPAAVIPVAAVAIGYPLEPPQPRTRYSEAQVHHEIW